MLPHGTPSTAARNARNAAPEVPPDPPLGLVLGYGMLDEAKIKEGVRRLATHLPTLIRSQD